MTSAGGVETLWPVSIGQWPTASLLHAPAHPIASASRWPAMSVKIPGRPELRATTDLDGLQALQLADDGLP